MLHALRRNRITNSALMIGAAVIVLHALESLTDNTIASAIGWFILAGVIVLYGEDIQMAIDDVLQPRRMLAYAVLYALSWAFVVYLVIVNPAGGILVPIVVAIPAAFGAFMSLIDVADWETQNMLKQRRRQPRRGLSRLIPV